MIIARKFILFAVTVLLIHFPLFENGNAKDRFQNRELFMEQRSEKQKSTYVTYKTNPDHYNVAGNATRTCGPGYNPMSKQHRQNHQYRRPHSHPYAPWLPSCAE